MNHADMLRWVALYVTAINSIECKKGEKIEVEASNSEGESILVCRTGKNHLDAFTRCVRTGMKKIPLPKS